MSNYKIIILLSLLFTGLSINSQSKLVGGPCEGCEAIYEYGEKPLKHVDTLPLFKELPLPIRISGTVYKKDGNTPAKNVILYVYHTNDKGVYPKKKQSKGWESRHGYLRGWMKTNEKGQYVFYTSRPASYPNTRIAQHIHITVKEPDKNEYYMDSFHFRDDPYLPKNIIDKSNPRGGSGIISLKKEGSLYVATRDIILGLNIPNY